MSIEMIIYLIVKIVCVMYILSDLWVFIFRRGINGLWNRLFDKTDRIDCGNSDRGEDVVFAEDADNEVMGKSKIIYYLDSDATRNTPNRSLELKEIEVKIEDDINPDDVEYNIESPIFLTEEEKMELIEYEGMMPDPDFDTSLTFEEMNNIVDVLKSDFSDEHKSIRAAETIHHKLADSVIFDFLVNKVSNEDRINRLLGECLDENGKPLAKRRKTTRTRVFDIEKYA